jgi:hypothetical protein
LIGNTFVKLVTLLTFVTGLLAGSIIVWAYYAGRLSRTDMLAVALFSLLAIVLPSAFLTWRYGSFHEKKPKES